MNKKGQIGLNDLPKISIVFLLAGIFFVLGIVILASFQTATTESLTIINESFTVPAVNGTFKLTHYKVTSLTSVANSTGYNNGIGNFTITSYDNSKIKYIDQVNTTVCITGQTCTITYVYDDYDTDAPVSIQNTITAMKELPSNWFTIIALIIATAVVVGIIMSNTSNFGVGGSRRE